MSSNPLCVPGQTLEPREHLWTPASHDRTLDPWPHSTFCRVLGKGQANDIPFLQLPRSLYSQRLIQYTAVCQKGSWSAGGLWFCTASTYIILTSKITSQSTAVRVILAFIPLNDPVQSTYNRNALLNQKLSLQISPWVQEFMKSSSLLVRKDLLMKLKRSCLKIVIAYKMEKPFQWMSSGYWFFSVNYL